MSNRRLPVERTIVDAYGFAFRRFGSVLGTIWLPNLVLAGTVLALVWLLAPDLPRMIAEQEFDIAALVSLGRLAALVAIIGFIVGAMVTVGLQRKALGLHPRPVWLWFSLGVPVWRMAGALLLGGLAVFLISLPTAGLSVAIWFAARALGLAMWPVRVLAVCAGASFIIYVGARLLFFLPAVVVAEEKLGLERAWALGGRNVWRMVVVALAIVVPVAIVFHLLARAIFGPLHSVNLGRTAGGAEFGRALFSQFRAAGPFVILFQLFERVVLLGVMNGAVASAYHSVASDGVAPAAAPPATAPR